MIKFESARKSRRVMNARKAAARAKVLRSKERKSTAELDARYISAGQYLVVTSDDPGYAGMRNNALTVIRTELYGQATSTVSQARPTWSRSSRDFGREVRREVRKLAQDAGIDPTLVVR